MNSNQTYKLRAECLSDINAFINNLGEISDSSLVEFKVTPIMVNGLRLPDCVLEVTSTLTIDDIRNVLAEIPDSHVMMETVTLKEKYTGDRSRLH
jgi:hypothetical protein